MRCKVAPISRKNIWDIVKAIRKNLGIVRQFYFDIVVFLELIMPKIMNDFSLQIVPDGELGDAYAETYPNQHVIKVIESTYNGACKGIPRDRFTLAHELGHLLLHNQVNDGYMQYKRTRINAYEDPEWQANIFAAELLAPSYLIENLSAEKIAKRCKVSMKCARKQLDNIEKENSKY